MHINAVESQDLNSVWPYILRYIQEPLKYEHGDLTPEVVYDMLEKKIWILLVAWEDNTIFAAQTCEIVNVNNERVMNLVTTGGRDLARWQDTLSAAIDAVAEQHNCKAIQTRGRIGWLRQLKRNGYTPLYFTAQKRLTPCQQAKDEPAANPRSNPAVQVTAKIKAAATHKAQPSPGKMSGNRKPVH